MKDYLSTPNITEFNTLIKSALALKKSPQQFNHLGKGKYLGMIFFNPSLRTRLSTDIAAKNLGLEVVSMNAGADAWQIEHAHGVVMNENKQEHIKEAAAVLGRYCDILALRSFPELQNQEEDYRENMMRNFKKYANKPLINLESATKHPLQALADLITIEEHQTKQKPKVVLTWAPHPRALPQSVANSFASACLTKGHDLSIVQPEGFELSDTFTSGAKIVYDQDEALENADFVYAKNWSSFRNYGQKGNNLNHWMLTPEKLKNQAKFMHSLPLRRNVVANDALMDSSANISIDVAENRIYAAQAVLKSILEHSL